MDSMFSRRKKFFPFLRNRNNRILFLVINIYLIIGIICLVITIFYLLENLNKADSILIYCIPGFTIGISSGFFYFIGYQSFISEKEDKTKKN